MQIRTARIRIRRRTNRALGHGSTALVHAAGFVETDGAIAISTAARGRPCGIGIREDARKKRHQEENGQKDIELSKEFFQFNTPACVFSNVNRVCLYYGSAIF